MCFLLAYGCALLRCRLCHTLNADTKYRFNYVLMDQANENKDKTKTSDSERGRERERERHAHAYDRKEYQYLMSERDLTLTEKRFVFWPICDVVVVVVVVFVQHFCAEWKKKHTPNQLTEWQTFDEYYVYSVVDFSSVHGYSKIRHGLSVCIHSNAL